MIVQFVILISTLLLVRCSRMPTTPGQLITPEAQITSNDVKELFGFIFAVGLKAES